MIAVPQSKWTTLTLATQKKVKHEMYSIKALNGFLALPRHLIRIKNVATCEAAVGVVGKDVGQKLYRSVHTI